MSGGQEQAVLDFICSHGGGMRVRDIQEATGLSYKQVMDEARTLIASGYYVRGIGVGDWTERLFLSPYDPKYKNLIKK